MMEDQELKELKEMRTQLIEKALNLIRKLKDQEENEQVLEIKESNVGKNRKEEGLPKDLINLLGLTKKVSGVSFENVDVKWLENDNYKCKLSLITKSLCADVELLIKRKSNRQSEICDFAFNFIELHRSYMLEVASFSKFVTEMKNFSYLTSAIFQYNDQYMIRKILLDKMKNKKYVNYKESSDKHGGILINVHSPINIAREYLTVQWVIAFRKRCWRFENHFKMGVVETEMEFIKKNRALLKSFLPKNLTKSKLGEAWSKLCFAIDLFEKERQDTKR